MKVHWKVLNLMKLSKMLIKVVSASIVAMAITSIVVRGSAESPGALVAVDTADDADGSVEDEDEASGITRKSESFVDENGDPFIPTEDWQVVKPGQSIPPGLHVRLNLATGLKEAKLMDEEVKEDVPSSEQIRVTDGTEPSRLQKMKQAIEAGMKKFDSGQSDSHVNYWKEGHREGMVSNKDFFSRDDLKQALKNFKATKADAREEKVPSTESGKKFRSMETIQKELKNVDLSIKTDPEIIRELLDQYQAEGATVANKLSALTDLEFYVHQIDNAQDFVDMGGMTLLIEELNNTDSSIRGQAAFVLGSAVQSNPKVQVQAIESGAMQQLLKMFSIEMSDQLESRVLYALSTLVRHFPAAQQKLVDLGGVHSLTQLLLKSSSKVKVKAVTLVNDLITERNIAEEQSKIQDTDAVRKKLDQYNGVHLKKNIVEQGWCDLVPSLLVLPEHDTREKIVSAMHTLLPNCAATFTKVIPSLRSLREEYSVQAEQEASENDSDSYFRDFFHRIEQVLSELEHNASKHEL